MHSSRRSCKMIKLDVYCGLLGVGKTTVIKKMLNTAYRNHKTAVVENEVGQINLDAEEMREAFVTVREITSGCICCTVKGSFTKSIDLLAEQEQPEYIVVEPSGVANLSDVVAACMESKAVCLNRVVMIINARRLQKLLKVIGNFFYDQIRIASTAYLNFTESLSPEEIEAVKITLWQINPRLYIIDTPLEEIGTETFPDEENSAEIFMGKKLPLGMRQFGRNNLKSRQVKIHSVKENGTDQLCYEFQNFFNTEKIMQLFDVFHNDECRNVWRVKGYLKEENGKITKVDYVFGDQYQEKVDSFTGNKLNILVIIGKDMHISRLNSQLKTIDDGA